jgi:hypothetical protein
MGNTDAIDKKIAVHAVGFGLTLVIYSMAGLLMVPEWYLLERKLRCLPWPRRKGERVVTSSTVVGVRNATGLG